MNIQHVRTLIEKSFSLAESINFNSNGLTGEQFEIFKEKGIEILKHYPPLPFNCAYMSAIWVELARKNGLSAYLVAGTLDLHGRRVFDYENTVENTSIIKEWNGHCWVMSNNMIGDASLFRTAYADSSPKWLQESIINSFGRGRGLVIGTHENLSEDGLIYSPKYVFTDIQLDGLLNSADIIMREYYKIPTDL